MSQSQAAVTNEQTGRDARILFFLKSVDALLWRYAALAHLDYDDLYQDACILIIDILQNKPERTHTRAYISTAVRSRILDKIKYTQRRQMESLDACVGERGVCLADLIPSGYSLDPLLVLLCKEERQEMKQMLSRRRKTKRVQEALTMLEEVMP
jgi:DNA-directed RNA polymerase specialized sigma24 family protein